MMSILANIALNGLAYILGIACVSCLALIGIFLWIGAVAGDPVQLTAILVAFPLLGLMMSAPLLMVVARRLKRR